MIKKINYLLIILLLIVSIFLILQPKSTTTLNNKVPRDVLDLNKKCPADVKQCPDGSYVGRISPNCDFAQCSAQSD